MSKWSDDAVAQLKALWSRGFSASEIAKRLGIGVKRNAVIGKASRLGLPMRKPSAGANDRTIEESARKISPNIEPLATRRREIVIPPETNPRKIAQRARHAKSLAEASNAGRNIKRKMRPARKSLPQIRIKVAPDDVIKRVTRTDRLARIATRSRHLTVEVAAQTPMSEFQELQRIWITTVRYLSRFAHFDPKAEDIVKAKERLAIVEAHWLELHEQSQGAAFVWPSTEAERGHGQLAAGDWMELGMLRYLGYSVSQAADLSDEHRRNLLASIFGSNLPPLNSLAYMRSWGGKASSARLQKMAESIAAFVRNEKRHGRRASAVAIQRWEADLSYLKHRFYVGTFRWPIT